MYCKLNENYILRGWDGVPDALIKRPENEIQFLKSDEYQALLFCDGETELNNWMIPFYIKEIISEYAKKGVVCECECGDVLSGEQKYRKYNNKFMESAHFSITGRCNYKCRHCYQSAPENKFGELDTGIALDIIRQIDECGIMHITISGGEPLIRDDFEELVKEITRRKIILDAIFSNGMLVTGKLLEMLASYGQKPRITISYDGDEGCHDWLRNRKGAGKIALDAFDLCYEHGFRTSAGFSLHHGNKHILRQSLQTLSKHHCGSVKVCPVDNFGQWQKHSDGKSMTSEDAFQIYLDYIPQYFEDGMPVSLMLSGAFYAEKETHKWSIPYDHKMCENDDLCYQKICGHALTHLYISPESRMMPCSELSGTALNEKFPLITEVGLKKGLTDSFYLNVIETGIEKYFEINKECGSCKYRFRCHGGCRATAATFDESDIYGCDRRTCAFFKGGWDKKIYDAAEKAAAKYLAQTKSKEAGAE